MITLFPQDFRQPVPGGPTELFTATDKVLDLLTWGGFLAAIIVAWFSRQREFRADRGSADAVAIGDSTSDLEMAPAVGRLWVTANGAAVDGMADRIAAVPNASVTAHPMGEGWAEAVLASL